MSSTKNLIKKFIRFKVTNNKEIDHNHNQSKELANEIIANENKFNKFNENKDNPPIIKSSIETNEDLFNKLKKEEILTYGQRESYCSFFY